MGEAIVLRDVKITYNGNIAVENVSFSLKEGESLLLLGPNGSGKTTLVKTIAGLHKEYKGEIKVFGKPPHDSMQFVSYMPQTFKLNETVPVTALDVVAMGVIYKKPFFRHYSLKKDVVEECREALEFVGLDRVAEQPFSELSGGQKQRVILARSLVSNPKMLLLDEPLSHLDPTAKSEVVEVLLEIRRKKKITMAVTTHDTNPLIEIGDKLLILNRKMVAFGPPEEALSDEIIRKVYGDFSRTIRVEGKVYCIIGDVHLTRHP